MFGFLHYVIHSNWSAVFPFSYILSLSWILEHTWSSSSSVKYWSLFSACNSAVKYALNSMCLAICRRGTRKGIAAVWGPLLFDYFCYGYWAVAGTKVLIICCFSNIFAAPVIYTNYYCCSTIYLHRAKNTKNIANDSLLLLKLCNTCCLLKLACCVYCLQYSSVSCYVIHSTSPWWSEYIHAFFMRG